MPITDPPRRHQSSSSGLATPGRSTKADMAPYIELDLQPHNVGLNIAWMRAQVKIASTRSSADADNRLDAFSSQSRSTNMVPFSVHCDFSLSM